MASVGEQELEELTGLFPLPFPRLDFLGTAPDAEAAKHLDAQGVAGVIFLDGIIGGDGRKALTQ